MKNNLLFEKLYQCVELDKFHLVQHIGRAFQKIRIKIMTQLKSKDNGLIFRRIKKDCEILQKSYDKCVLH
ncbi:hypothetical protein DW196_04005 [Vagococcus sp. AM17-17]|nr:hypothetical protein DW196_04005 [Vagococcus sp. AM17-17]